MKSNSRLPALLALAAVAPFASAQTSAPQPDDLLRFEREDVAVFREKFVNADLGYTPESRAEVERRLRRIEQANRPLEPFAFRVELCRLAALADNGHTQCLDEDDARATCAAYAVLDRKEGPGCELRTPDFTVPEFKRVPIGFYPFGTDFYVSRTLAKDADLLGAHLLAVDGKPIKSIQPTLRSFQGGTIPFRDLGATAILNSPDQLHAVGIARNGDAVTYRFQTPAGTTVERQFKVADSSKEDWKRLPTPEHAPWSLQEQDKVFRWRDAPEIDAIVVQLRVTVDNGGVKLLDFLEEAEANRTKRGRHNVVLDMRANGGGNLILAREFFMHWPERVAPPGKFYVLSSRRTFSAAIASIAYLKQAGKERVVLVGEPPGDRLVFSSDGRPIQLPHSGLFFRPSTARMDYQNGCQHYDDCHVAVAQPGHRTAPFDIAGIDVNQVPRMPIAIPSLEPDIAAPETIESRLTGTDPGMDAIARASGKPPKTQS
jgi:hypothetical protein